MSPEDDMHFKVCKEKPSILFSDSYVSHAFDINKIHSSKNNIL